MNFELKELLAMFKSYAGDNKIEASLTIGCFISFNYIPTKLCVKNNSKHFIEIRQDRVLFIEHIGLNGEEIKTIIDIDKIVHVDLTVNVNNNSKVTPVDLIGFADEESKKNWEEQQG